MIRADLERLKEMSKEEKQYRKQLMEKWIVLSEETKFKLIRKEVERVRDGGCKGEDS